MVLELREFLNILKCSLGSERIPENHLKMVLDVNCDEEIPKNAPKRPKQGLGCERIPENTEM